MHIVRIIAEIIGYWFIASLIVVGLWVVLISANDKRLAKHRGSAR